MPLLAVLRLPKIRLPPLRQNVVILTPARPAVATVIVTVPKRMATSPVLAVSRIAVTTIGAAPSAGDRSPR